MIVYIYTERGHLQRALDYQDTRHNGQQARAAFQRVQSCNCLAVRGLKQNSKGWGTDPLADFHGDTVGDLERERENSLN